MMKVYYKMIKKLIIINDSKIIDLIIYLINQIFLIFILIKVNLNKVFLILINKINKNLMIY